MVVVELETGGRWSDEALHFIETLASGRARDMVPVLRRPAFLMASEMDPHVVDLLQPRIRFFVALLT